MTSTEIWPSPETPIEATSGLPQALVTSLVVTAVLCLTLPRLIYFGDAVAIRDATVHLLVAGDISVPAERAVKFGERGQYFFENTRTGRWYPKYGPLNTLLYVPPLFVEQQVSGGKLEYSDQLTPHQQQRRCLLLNLYQLVINAAAAVYLFRTARLYTRFNSAAAFYTLWAFFGTFLWNYCRAQTSEIFQVLFFCGCYYHLIRYRRGWESATAAGTPQRRAHAWAALGFAALLTLGKLIFILLWPAVVAGLVLTPTPLGAVSRGWRQVLRNLRHVAIPVVVTTVAMLGLTLGLNWYRFNSMFESGYAQWEHERAVLTTHISAGLIGYLIDPRKSVFLHFPLLAFAVLGARSFYRKFTFDAKWIAGVTVLFFVANSAFVNWRGDWCYGPRYLLFLLPVLALPVLEVMANSPAGWYRRLVLTGMLLTGLWGIGCQWRVNRIEYFAAFRAEACFAGIADAEIQRYFNRPIWAINQDLIRFQANRSNFPPLEKLRRIYPKSQTDALANELRSFVVGNMYWLDGK